MKKAIALAMASVMAAGLLAGCGGSASSASSSASSAVSSGAASQSASEPAASVTAEENGASDAVASAVDALLETNPISNQFEITAMNIEYDFGLKADDVTSYKGIKSNDNGDAGLVLAIQPAAGKAQDVMDLSLIHISEPPSPPQARHRMSWTPSRPTSRIRWPSTATTPSSLRHSPTWRMPSSTAATTSW